MALIVGGVTVTGTQTLDASKLTGTASAINGSNITNLPAPSTANVGSATAGLSASAVGSYAFLYDSGLSGYAIGSTLSGSSLRPSNAGGVFNGNYSPSGTWRCMGQSEDSTATRGSTLWLRIS